MSVLYTTLQCDAADCQSTFTFGGSYSKTVDASKREGWTNAPGRRHYCDKCTANRKPLATNAKRESI